MRNMMEFQQTMQGSGLIIGLDEAGYGPNLGPLVIGGSAWLTRNDNSEADFCKAFKGTFSTTGWSKGCEHIPLGDSKKLYQSGCGLDTLEVGLLSMLQMVSRPSRNLAELLNVLTENFRNVGQEADSDAWSTLPFEWLPRLVPPLPWYEKPSKIHIPHNERVECQRLAELSVRAAEILQSNEIQLLSVKAIVIAEPEFNRHVQQLGSKASLLSKATLALAARLRSIAPGVPATIFCDRQGGRKNYLPQLLDWLPDRWFIETEQTTSRCSYQAEGQPDLKVHFSVGGDSFPATALASMAAKYLRERLMESFNVFWQSQVQGIRPTAGYPEDAKRFRKEILPTARKLALEEENWWRSR